jgi:4-hydroxybenzoate polyprenyltransferase
MFHFIQNTVQVIRYKNLLFLAFIQFAMQQFVVSPIMQKYGFEYINPNSTLYLLLAATLFIAAAGYVINDYFDIKIDRINKPDKQIVGNNISKKQAMLLHQILSGIGIVCGLILAYQLKSFSLAFLFIVVPGLLWFYSASYKRQFLTGNIVVALLAGLSVLVVGITAVADLKHTYSNLVFETTIPAEIYSWIGGFALFSFLLTLIRELVKDMQDVEGDKEMECHTVAIVWGEKRTKILIYTLVVLVIALLIFVSTQYIPFANPLSFKYILFGLIVPLLAFCYLIFKAADTKRLHVASTFLKYIMLLGVLYSVIFYFLLAQQYGLSLFNVFTIR